MLADLVQVQFDKIMQTRSYTVIVLVASGFDDLKNFLSS